MLSQFQKNEILETCKKYIVLANTIYANGDILFDLPKITYDVSGTCAGTANFKAWQISFNSIIFAENYENSLKNTIPHEIAHLIDNYLKFNTRNFKTNGRHTPHGNSWKRIMLNFGVTPNRCHNYDTTNAKLRNTKKFSYFCKCGINPKVGFSVHKKIQYNKKQYIAKCCRTILASTTIFKEYI